MEHFGTKRFTGKFPIQISTFFSLQIRTLMVKHCEKKSFKGLVQQDKVLKCLGNIVLSLPKNSDIKPTQVYVSFSFLF